MTRDIAMKFNETYGRTFVITESRIREEVAVIPGIDGQKMSKSYGNTIEIFGDEKTIRKKVMSIITDSQPVEAPKKNLDQCVPLELYKLVATPAQFAEMETRLKAGGFGYGELKKQLFAALWEYFAPF